MELQLCPPNMIAQIAMQFAIKSQCKNFFFSFSNFFLKKIRFSTYIQLESLNPMVGCSLIHYGLAFFSSECDCSNPFGSRDMAFLSSIFIRKFDIQKANLT